MPAAIDTVVIADDDGATENDLGEMQGKATAYYFKLLFLIVVLVLMNLYFIRRRRRWNNNMLHRLLSGYLLALELQIENMLFRFI